MKQKQISWGQSIEMAMSNANILFLSLKVVIVYVKTPKNLIMIHQQSVHVIVRVEFWVVGLLYVTKKLLTELYEHKILNLLQSRW